MGNQSLRPQLEVHCPMDMDIALQLKRVNMAIGDWVTEIGTNYRIMLHSVAEDTENERIIFLYEAVTGGKGERYG